MQINNSTDSISNQIQSTPVLRTIGLITANSLSCHPATGVIIYQRNWSRSERLYHYCMFAVSMLSCSWELKMNNEAQLASSDGFFFLLLHWSSISGAARINYFTFLSDCTMFWLKTSTFILLGCSLMVAMNENLTGPVMSRWWKISSFYQPVRLNCLPAGDRQHSIRPCQT